MARLDTLISDRWNIVAYKNLPRPHQLAMAWYMAVDGEAWGESIFADLYDSTDFSRGSDDAGWHRFWNNALEERLDQFIAEYGDIPFGMVMFTRDEILDSIAKDFDFVDHSRDQVFNWIAGASDSPYPKHGLANRRPVILSHDDYGTLEDGWHRVGHYLASEQGDIPALFYPLDCHLAAHAERTIPLWRCESDEVEGRRPFPDDSWQQEGLRSSGQWDAIGRWFTNDPSTLQFYASDANGPVRIVRVDATPAEIEAWSMQANKEAASFSRDHQTEFFLPRERAEAAWRDQELEATLELQSHPAPSLG